MAQSLTAWGSPRFENLIVRAADYENCTSCLISQQCYHPLLFNAFTRDRRREVKIKCVNFKLVRHSSSEFGGE